MCKMLLSINPEHVENIFSGAKKFEFRKVRCRSEVDRIVIYSTSPVMKIVGEAEVLNVIEGLPAEVWEQTEEYAGIKKTFFDQYYEGKNKAVAYHLGIIKQYQRPLNLSDFGVRSAPQSFVYLD